MPKKDILKFNKTLLDKPINLTRKRVVKNNKLALEPLPEPLKPTKYITEKPVPKPRKKAPVSLPRKVKPKPLNRKVSKLISLIKPYYSPEKIEKFKKKLKFIKKVTITKIKKALKGNLANYQFSIMNEFDPSMQLIAIRKELKEKLTSLLNEKKGLKFGVSLKTRMKKETEDGVIYREPYFNSKAKTITHPDMINSLIREAEEEILNKIADWISEGSNWVLELVLDHYLNIISYTPLKGSSYIKLPEKLQNSMLGLINPKNLDDNECFRWCHVRKLNPEKKNPQRIKNTDKEFVKKLDYSGISFPVSYKDYHKIEKQNQININVFGYQGFVYPIYTSKEKYDNNLEVLYIEEGEKSHYVLITDFDRLMNNYNKHKEKKNFCKYCLHCFRRKEILVNHGHDCFALNGTQKIELPAPGSKVFFKNYNRIQPAPFVIYADFEALTKKIDTCIPNNDKSYTNPYQEHKTCGYGYKLVCHQDQKYSKPVSIYRGKNVVKNFIESIYREVSNCKRVIKKHFNKPLIMTSENELDFQNSTHCYICEKEYSDEDNFIMNKGKKIEIKNHPVRDHCHITGKYRGSAHNCCNLQLRLDPDNLKILVIFHNLKGYDSHFIIKTLGKNFNINVIAQNFEKYISFTIDSLKFLDSFQFMSSSLDKLSNNLTKNKFIYTDLEFKGLSPYQLELLKKKGVYPYSYMDSFDRFEETELPSIDKFYNDLNNTAITESDYQHANEVFESFKIKNLGEYHDLYLKTDVLLLADVFENFRDTCLKSSCLRALRISRQRLFWHFAHILPQDTL